MNKSESAIVEALSKSGIKLSYDGDELAIEPTVLRMKYITINTAREAIYKTNPAYVPPELQQDNLMWIERPPEYYAITNTGEKIPLYLTDGVTINREDIYPDAVK